MADGPGLRPPPRDTVEFSAGLALGAAAGALAALVLKPEDRPRRIPVPGRNGWRLPFSVRPRARPRAAAAFRVRR